MVIALTAGLLRRASTATAALPRRRVPGSGVTLRRPRYRGGAPTVRLATGRLAAAADGLATFGQDGGWAADLPALAAAVVRRAAETFQADVAWLYLQHHPGGRVEILAADGLAPAGNLDDGAAVARPPGWVIRSQQPFLSNDTRRDPRVMFVGRGPRLRSLLFAPVAAEPGQAVGALVVCAHRTNAFTARHLALLRIMADQCGVAIAHGLLVAEAGQRADRLARVSLAGQHIASRLTLGEVLATSIDEAAAVFEVGFASAYALDRHGRIAAEAHHRGLALCAMTDLSWLGDSERPLVVPDLRAADALPDLRLRLLERGVHSVLVVPVGLEGRRLGAMLLYATGGRPAFSRETQELAGIIAGQLAVAIEHARQYQSALDARRRGEAILQSSFAAILTTDRRWRIQAVNAAAAEIFGLAAKELERRPLMEVFGAAAWDAVGPTIAAQQAGQPPGPPVECVIEGGGAAQRREVLLGAAALSDGYVVSMTDITRLKELDRLKNELMANVSHDLKAPLATIRTYTELLLEGLDEDDPALRQEFLRHIDDEVERLNGYITNMLDLARIEAEGFKPRRERQLVNRVLDEAVAAVRPRARARGVDLEASPLPGHLTFWADHHLFLSLLVNLIDNAVKFSPEHSQVLIQAEVGSAGDLRLIIRDRGRGIPAEHLPHVFEKFYRAAPTAESGVDGSGLGLVIARQAARAHGGDITVSSVVGEGSTFTVVLPAGTVSEATPGPDTTTAPT